MKRSTLKNKKKPSRATLKRKCWTLMSEIVRRQDADWRGYVACYTCGKQRHWKEMHAGHFKHNKLDFDERNLKPQCPGCNTYRGGRLDVYAINLVKDYGMDWVEQLVIDAAQEKVYTVNDYEEIYARLEQKVHEVRKKVVD